MTTERRRRQRGSVVLLALVAMLVGFTIIVGMLEFGNLTLVSGQHEARLRSARAIAEAGVDFGYWNCAYNAATLPYSVSSRAFGSGTFRVTVSENDATIQKTIQIVSTGTVRGESVTLTRVVANPLVKSKITGTVFEDVGYGGGAGRGLTAASGVGCVGARVELYDASGSFVTATTTDSNGLYTFAGIVAGTSGTVRVVGSTVASTRSGAVGTLVPVLTFRTNAASGVPVDVTDHVGGEIPDRLDAGNGGTTLDALTTTTTTPQAIAPVTTGSSDLTGIDFGFNFDTVVNVNDSGRGSLRQVLTNANALSNTGLAQNGRPAGIENVVFMLADGTARPGTNTSMPTQFSGGIATITPLSALPTITAPLIVDAATQAGYSTATYQPIVELNGVRLGASANGLSLSGSLSSSVVRGVCVDRFNIGIAISGASSGSVTLQANWIGLTSAGGAGAGNRGIGVYAAGIGGNTIGGATAADRNVVSGNAGEGIYLASAGNTVQGNYVGTNTAGTGKIANTNSGIFLDNGAGNTISGNVVSGNTSAGVYVYNSGATNNAITGNTIGLNADVGIYVNGAPNNTISGNTVSGNASAGIYLYNTGATGNVIQNNTISANANTGIYVNGAPNNTIGGTAGATARNVIGGNTGAGIFLNGSATNTTIQGNYIGTNAAGTGAVPNTDIGVYVNGAANCAIGGSTAGAGNLISGNANTGIFLNGSGASGATIQGNTIGLNAAGTAALANAGSGIYGNGAPTGTITGNVVSGNASHGIVLNGSGATGVTVSGNYVGTNATGTAAIANAGCGIYVNAAPNNTIGGATAAARNIVSGNGSQGVGINGSGASGNLVQGNTIGANAAGTAAIANVYRGVWLQGGANANTINGNLISGNTDSGVVIDASGTTSLGNTISGNTIGLNVGGTAAVPNTATGVYIVGAVGNTISNNVVSGNASHGVLITANGATALNTSVQGNYIGTNAAGTAAVANGASGIAIAGVGNTIGGTTAAARNIISGNADAGINLYASGATGNTIQGNYIGLNAAGTAGVSNTNIGIYLNGGASSNTIGGATASTRNVIASNSDGININGGGTGNVVKGNYIGTDAAGTGTIGNRQSGVTVTSGSGNSIGGANSGEGNVVTGSGTAGIWVQNGSTGNALRRNAVYANTGLGIDLGTTGVTTNNGTKNSGLANNDMDYPVVTLAQLSGTTLTFGGYVGSASGQATFGGATVEIYKSSLNSSGYGGGRTYLGVVTAAADGTFTGSLTGTGIVPGDKLTATATDASGNTSEFGPNRSVIANYVFSNAFFSNASFSNSNYAFVLGSGGANGDVRSNGNLSMTAPGTIVNGTATASGTLSITSVTAEQNANYATFPFPSLSASYYAARAASTVGTSIYNGGSVVYPYTNVIVYVNGDLYINGATTFYGNATVFVAGNVYINANCLYGNTSSKFAILTNNTVTLNSGATSLVGLVYAHNDFNTGTIVVNGPFSLNGSLVADQLTPFNGSGTISITRDPTITPTLGNTMRLPGY